MVGINDLINWYHKIDLEISEYTDDAKNRFRPSRRYCDVLKHRIGRTIVIVDCLMK